MRPHIFTGTEHLLVDDIIICRPGNDETNGHQFFFTGASWFTHAKDLKLHEIIIYLFWKNNIISPMHSFSGVRAQIVTCFVALLCVSLTTANVHRYCFCLTRSPISAHFRCPFCPGGVTHVSMFDLSSHKGGCKYQNQYIKAPTGVSAPSALPRMTHSCQTDWTKARSPRPIVKKDIGGWGPR